MYITDSTHRQKKKERIPYLTRGKMSRFFLDPEIFFVPYLTLTSTFIPNLTLPSNPLANGVNWLLKRRFCTQKKSGEANLRGKKPAPFFAAGRMHQRRAQVFFLLKFASPLFFQGQKCLFHSQLTPLANGFDGSVKLWMKVEVSVNQGTKKILEPRKERLIFPVSNKEFSPSIQCSIQNQSFTPFQ